MMFNEHQRNYILSKTSTLIMEQLTEQVTIRVTPEDVELLREKAAEQKRSVAWIARECMRQGLIASQ